MLITDIKPIFEAQQNRVVLVDFQPAYHKGSQYERALQNACSYINRNERVEVIAFFNNEDIGVDDTKYDVMEHYIVDGGLQEECLANIEFTSKIYSFLRPWMDIGVDPTIIKQAVRYMLLNKIVDSRDIPNDVYDELVGDYNIYRDDNIFLPDISIKQLKTFSNCLMGGGARHECYREIQLLMSVFNIRNKEVQQWIYG